MRLIQLTRMIQELCVAADSGRFKDVAPREVVEHAEARDLIPWMRQRLAPFVGLDLIPGAAEAEFHDKFESYLNAYCPGDWSVERSGVLLLVAVATEFIQQRDFVEDDAPRRLAGGAAGVESEGAVGGEAGIIRRVDVAADPKFDKAEGSGSKRKHNLEWLRPWFVLKKAAAAGAHVDIPSVELALQEVPELPALRVAARARFHVADFTDSTLDVIEDWLCIEQQMDLATAGSLPLATVIERIKA